jgi:putative membrane protein
LGCAGTAQEQPSTVVTTSATFTPPQATATVVNPESADTYGDDQVLGLVAALNTAGLDLATVGAERASDERVQHLAKLFVDEHTVSRDQEARLSERLALHPAPTDRMRVMQLDATLNVDRLKGLSGRAFDTAWLQEEVVLQRDGLALIDLGLIPSTRIPEMQSHLADLRDHIDHHLRDVADLRRSE